MGRSIQKKLSGLVDTVALASALALASSGGEASGEDACATEMDEELCVTCREVTLLLERDCVRACGD